MQEIIAANGAVKTVTPLSIVTWTAEAVRVSGADGSDRVVALYGEAAGGIPANPYVFTDPVQASKVLLSGELLKGIQYAFSNGAPDGKRPRAIIGVNVRGGSQASFAVKDADDAVAFTLKTLTYREVANQTTFSLSGSRATGFNLQVRDSISGAALGYTKLGIGLYLQYIGGGKSATAQIVSVAGKKNLRIVVTGGAAGEGLLLPLTELTVRELAQKIQSSGPYNVFSARTAVLAAEGLDLTATAVDIMAYGVVGEIDSAVATGATSLTFKAATTRAYVSGETLKLRDNGVWRFLQVAADAASGVTALTVVATTFPISADAVILDGSVADPKALSAVKADFEDFLRVQGSGVVEYVPGDDAAGDPVAQGGNFAGGGSQPATITDWEAGVEASLDADFGSAVALTNDQGVVFGVRARLEAAKQPTEGKFIQLFMGVDESTLPSGESDAELSAYEQNVRNLTATINSRDGVLVAQTGETTNPQTGRLQRIAPYFVAAMLAGYAASVGRNISLTYKSLRLTNPFPNLRTRKDAFTLAGVTVLVPPKKGEAARVELGRTTWVGEDNTIYELEKSVRLCNGIARDLKGIQAALVPGEASKAALGRYKRELTVYFDALVAADLLQAGRDQEGNLVQPYEFSIGRTQYQGRLVTTTAKVNPTSEFVVADLALLARPVEIEV